jgi:2-dehydropantoate 2-reductase
MQDTKSVDAAHLTIAVVGAGGIGSTFAYQLAQAGHAVTVIARAESLRSQQLQRDQGVVKASGPQPAIQIADHLDDGLAYDLGVVTTLAHQVDAVLPALQRSPAKASQFMFNNFEPERLTAAVGPQRCSFGMPFVAATVREDGTLSATINPGQKTLHGDARWAALFNAAGLPSSFEPDMPLWLRCHVPMCVAMESICATAQRRGAGATWSEAMTVARGVHGGYAVIAGLGYRIYPGSKVALRSSPPAVVAAVLWFVSRIKTFRALLATGVNECQVLAGVMAEAATRTKPVLPAARAAILAMTPGENAQKAAGRR